MVFPKRFNISGFIIFSLFLAACRAQQPELSPQQLDDFSLLIQQADDLFSQGSYLSLKKAFDIYESQIDFPVFQIRTRTQLLKTALLLCQRENELTIVEDRHMAKAAELIESHTSLSDFSPLLALIIHNSPEVLTPLHGDTLRIDDLADSTDLFEKNIPGEWETYLREKAETDSFYAYFYFTFLDTFPDKLNKDENFERFDEIFKDSHFISYKMSVFPKPDRKLIESLLEKHPDFFESHFYLGNLALAERKILTAEKNLLIALNHIPSSISTLRNLAQVSYILEEFEASLEYNENILAYLPGYRDALLGKAICQSYLGRHEEAVAILNRLIEQGTTLMGESHYWLAWNLNGMGQLDPAMENVIKSLNYLTGHSEIHLLAGIVAFEMDDIDGSEVQLNRALAFNPGECEASYYLGKIESIRNNWERSAIHFENAAFCNGGLEGILLAAIREIEKSSFSAARKEKHIARKTIQLKRVQVTKATAFYNAAACYFNAGFPDKAKLLAQRAREHKAMQAQADELTSKIKSTDDLPARNKKRFQLYK